MGSIPPRRADFVHVFGSCRRRSGRKKPNRPGFREGSAASAAPPSSSTRPSRRVHSARAHPDLGLLAAYEVLSEVFPPHGVKLARLQATKAPRDNRRSPALRHGKFSRFVRVLPLEVGNQLDFGHDSAVAVATPHLRQARTLYRVLVDLLVVPQVIEDRRYEIAHINQGLPRPTRTRDQDEHGFYVALHDAGRGAVADVVDIVHMLVKHGAVSRAPEHPSTRAPEHEASQRRDADRNRGHAIRSPSRDCGVCCFAHRERGR